MTLVLSGNFTGIPIVLAAKSVKKNTVPWFIRRLRQMQCGFTVLFD